MIKHPKNIKFADTEMYVGLCKHYVDGLCFCTDSDVGIEHSEPKECYFSNCFSARNFQHCLDKKYLKNFNE